MKKHLYIITIAVVSLVSGCISPDRAMRSFLDHHSSDLLASWGPPQSKMSDGNGGEAWTYYSEKSFTSPGSSQTTMQGSVYESGNYNANPYGGTYNGNSFLAGSARTTYTPPQTYRWTNRRTFFINAGGIIYRYAWQGL